MSSQLLPGDGDGDKGTLTQIGATVPEPATRISHEGAVLGILTERLADLPDAVVTRGQGAGNKFGVPGWDLSARQLFQFGDLRVELPVATLVVEAESAGGVGNLAKYWPLLKSHTLSKKLVLAHMYMLGSVGDYIAHRRLWEFLVEQMEGDLRNVGVLRHKHWDARLFTYRTGEPLTDVVEFLRNAATAVQLP
jgi:hypothetical protein